MAEDISNTKFFSLVRAPGTQPSNPGSFEEPQPVVNPPGTQGANLYTSLGDTTDANYLGKNGYVPVVVNERELTLFPFPEFSLNRLINGGVVQWTGTGYNFNVSEANAIFDSVPLNSSPDTLTLTTPDATNDRIDLFVLDITFSSGIPVSMAPNFITGTPAATPVEPQIDPSYQIRLTSVDVHASSTEPTLTEEVIYDENTEWAGTTAGTGTVDFASTADPFQGTVSVETTDIQNGFFILFNNGSTIDISTFQTLGFEIKLKSALGANQNLVMAFYDGSANIASNSIPVVLDKNSTDYQFVGLALNTVNFLTNDIQYIRFFYSRSSGSPVFSGYFLDIIKLEGGINPPVTIGSFTSLSDTPNSYVGQGGKSVAVKADESGLEFVTGGGGGISDAPNDGLAYARKSLGWVQVTPYDLKQEGATDGQVLTWVNANSRYEPVTPSGGGGSNWTVVGSDIYRDSNVAVGRTTIPSNGTGSYTFSVQSKATGLGTASRYFLLESSANIEHFTVWDGGLVQVNPAGINNVYLTFGNITGFSNGRGVIVRPTASGYSIITTDTAGTLARFAVADTGAMFVNGLASLGVTVGTTINPWGTGIRGVSSGFAARKALIVQNGGAVEMFAVRSNGYIDMPNLPTASTGIAGVLWNDAGTLKIG